jgi:hypothetical protein
MKARVLKSLLMCSLLLVCAVSFAFAAIECSIVSSSIPWDQGDQGTWVSDTYQLTIQCKDNNVAVVGYQAKFDISLMEGANYEKKIATLITYSTPTDSEGFATINVPLIHIQKNDGKYIHICPFDDISCSGGVNSPSMAAPLTSSKTASFTTMVATGGCTNTNVMPGCCETTITITCCTPNRVFTYCTTVPVGQCPVGTTHPDICTTIFTQYAPGGICDYCTGKCDISTLITLSSFTAKASNGRVKLEWVTESEIENAGFNIYRSETEADGYVKINSALIAAKGSETKGAKYVFTDNIAKNRKTYFYKLEDIDLNGTSTMHGPKSATPRMILGILGK